MNASARAATLCVATAAALPLLAKEPDLELGEYLATECATCHRVDAVNHGIPSIFGMPSVVFLHAMEQYRDGTRINEAMRNVARSLTADDLAALAAYLERAAPRR